MYKMKQDSLNNQFSYNEFIKVPLKIKEPTLTLSYIRKKKQLSKYLLSKKYSCIIIQTYLRRYLAKIYVGKLKKEVRNNQFNSQFDTIEKAIRFNFIQNGAVLKIQKFFKCSQKFRPFYKARWRKKHFKFILKQVHLKNLYPIFKKIGKPLENFSENDLYINSYVENASVIYIQKIYRGLLGRQR